MWDVHTNENNWVYMPRPIAHEPACVPRGPIPDGFWVVWEGPPYHPHSLGGGLKCRRGKGLKTICIAPHCTSVGMEIPRLNLGQVTYRRTKGITYGIN